MWETHARADGVHTASINPPNVPVAESVGSVRIDCRSWCRAGDDLRLAQARVSELLNGSGRVDLEPPVPIAAAMATSQSSPVVTGPSQLRRWRWRADRIRRVVEKGRLGAYSYDRPVPACCRREDATAARGSVLCWSSRIQAGTTDWLRRSSQLTAG